MLPHEQLLLENAYEILSGKLPRKASPYSQYAHFQGVADIVHSKTIYHPEEWLIVWDNFPFNASLANNLLREMSNPNFTASIGAGLLLPAINQADTFQQLNTEVSASTNTEQKISWLAMSGVWLSLPDDLISAAQKSDMFTSLLNEFIHNQDSVLVKSAWLKLLNKAKSHHPNTNNYRWIKPHKHRLVKEAFEYAAHDLDSALMILTDSWLEEEFIDSFADSRYRNNLFSAIHYFITNLPRYEYPLSKFREAENILTHLNHLISRLPKTADFASEAMRWLIGSRIQLLKIEEDLIDYSSWSFWFQNIIRFISSVNPWIPESKILFHWQFFEKKLSEKENSNAAKWYQSHGFSYFDQIAVVFQDVLKFIENELPQLKNIDHRQWAFHRWYHIQYYLFERNFIRNPEASMLSIDGKPPPWVADVLKVKQYSHVCHMNLQDQYACLAPFIGSAVSHFQDFRVFVQICEQYGIVGKLWQSFSGNPLNLEIPESRMIKTVLKNASESLKKHK